MAKIQKKGKKGAAANFVTRNQALKKLQISLADFRRLCILKGIYPREPRNKKKANKGSTAPTTFYYHKDIQYLLHEPVLYKFREHKAFAKKLAKVLAKGQYSTAKSLEEHNKPVYTLDHIVKERYPTFVDAVRDLDDALSMLFLFATMPVTEKIKREVVEECQRLTAEFQIYVMKSRSLRKVFFSIKGIYYQAEIKGQTVTWLVPYQFAQTIPTDVDFRVMLTFLEFYRTLVGFINFRLFSEINLVYPPKLDLIKYEGAAGFNALILEAMHKKAPDAEETIDTEMVEEETEETAEDVARKAASKERLKTLGNKLAELQGTSDADRIDEDAQVEVEETAIDEFKATAPTNAAVDGDDSMVTLSQIQAASTEIQQLQNLFSRSIIYLSRETPRYALEFIIRSFGGQVSWDETAGSSAPFSENDEKITHQVCDRPTQTHRFLNRTYIQPQWIADSINSRKLVIPDYYAPGRMLPPHLSPFVEAKEGDYVPSTGVEEEEDEAFEGETEDINPEDIEAQDDEEVVDSADEEDEEEAKPGVTPKKVVAEDHEAELHAEAAGVAFTEYDEKPTPGKKASKSVAGKKRTAKEIEEEEAKELASIMMSNKQKKLYNKIKYSQNKKSEETAKLEQRKQDIAKAKANANKRSKK
ncbi:pescadillo-family BRCT domain protein [Umbelopsis sp. PMI_123]|nr:pescadillo-family BRCT domain protein [Umbelopsis sp. PMI_123]